MLTFNAKEIRLIKRPISCSDNVYTPEHTLTHTVYVISLSSLWQKNARCQSVSFLCVVPLALASGQPAQPTLPLMAYQSLHTTVQAANQRLASPKRPPIMVLSGGVIMAH